MRAAWFSGWRPGMKIISLDVDDASRQLQLRDEGKIATITPKFIDDTKFSKYATTTLKKNLYKNFEDDYNKQVESQQKKLDKSNIILVDDNDYERAIMNSDKVVIPKNKEKVSPMNYQTTPLNDEDLKFLEDN